MAVLNPDHLLEQAARLIEPPPAGPPRQVDVRRAISAAYYAVFHHVLTAAADEVIGAVHRKADRYALVYRSIAHRTLRDLCEEVGKPAPAKKYRSHVPTRGFGPNLPVFASGLVELYEKRHGADYDPSIRVKTSDALSAIKTARSAIRRFDRANPLRRKTFLTLLLFPPR